MAIDIPATWRLVVLSNEEKKIKTEGKVGHFLESEKPNQTEFKVNSPYLSDAARAAGNYKGKDRPFCLPRAQAEENLFPGIQKAARDHFANLHIKWHDGQDGKPSNHLCDSQVCCVNFLFPLADNPDALAAVLQTIFPEIEKMIPVECGQYVSFEWIGQYDYLCENKREGSRRTRGANCTSADAIVMFEREDKRRQAVLVEWKYTESYGGAFLERSKSGTDRTMIYKRLFDRPDCPIDKEILPGYETLFYEPFYQFMRQQFLALEMEKAHELGADVVSVLHIAPAHNLDFRRITSPELAILGQSATEVWKKLVKTEGRFTSVATENLFGNLPLSQYPEIKSWAEYLYSRYGWVRPGSNSPENFKVPIHAGQVKLP